MDATRSCFALLLFLLGAQLSAAHPVSLSPAKELASMEALLERLEGKIALMEDLQNVDSEEADAPRDDGPGFLGDGSDDRQAGPRVGFAPFPSGRSAAFQRLRGLQAPKSVRESGCFGRRLDRIGSVSGMGCRGSRRN